jgi:hypothetical protein
MMRKMKVDHNSGLCLKQVAITGETVPTISKGKTKSTSDASITYFMSG